VNCMVEGSEAPKLNGGMQAAKRNGGGKEPTGAAPEPDWRFDVTPQLRAASDLPHHDSNSLLSSRGDENGVT